MGPVIGHLGPRVSALLDGQLSADETERAWAHVHACHTCRDLVEREGWVKTRLAGLSHAGDAAPAHLKGSLLGVTPHDLYRAVSAEAAQPLRVQPLRAGSLRAGSLRAGSLRTGPRQHDTRQARTVGLAALGGSAVGAAVMGVLALGAAPADAPTIDRRVPVTSITSPAPSPLGGTPGRDVP